ncbi:protein of unknown function [Paraburkholderia kururiensis]
MGALAAGPLRADGRGGRVALQGRRGRRARGGPHVRTRRRAVGPHRVEFDGFEERLEPFEPRERGDVADRQRALAALGAPLILLLVGRRAVPHMPHDVAHQPVPRGARPVVRSLTGNQP